MTLTLLTALVVNVALVFANVTGNAPRHTPTQQPFIPLMRAGDVLPDVPLVDQNGRRFSLRRSGAPTLLSFAYTRCADARMCPLVTAKFANLRALLAGTGIRLVEVTLDPAYDRPAQLRRYARAAGATAPGWSFATGNPADVFALAARLAIATERVSESRITHSESVAIIAGDGTLERLIDGNAWAPRDVAAAARATAALPSDPFRRLALALFARATAACGASGPGGVPLALALAIFAVCLTLAAWCVKRLFPSATW